MVKYIQIGEEKKKKFKQFQIFYVRPVLPGV